MPADGSGWTSLILRSQKFADGAWLISELASIQITPGYFPLER